MIYIVIFCDILCAVCLSTPQCAPPDMVAGENTSGMGGGFVVSRMGPSEVLSLAGDFVVQYYTVMRKCPSGLHRFYKDDSSMIRENATVFGQKMIHEKIMSMNIGNSRVGILRLDALRANGNSVLIQVLTFLFGSPFPGIW